MIFIDMTNIVVRVQYPAFCHTETMNCKLIPFPGKLSRDISYSDKFEIPRLDLFKLKI